MRKLLLLLEASEFRARGKTWCKCLRVKEYRSRAVTHMFAIMTNMCADSRLHMFIKRMPPPSLMLFFMKSLPGHTREPRSSLSSVYIKI